MTATENRERAHVNVARATMLVAASRKICSDALWTVVRAQDTRRAPRMCGADDDGLVASLLAGKTLCGPCIAHKAAIKVSAVYEALRRISRTVKLHMIVSHCEDCQQETVVHRIG